jgi:ribosomal protein L29
VSGLEWAGIITAVTGLLVAIAKGAQWTIELILSQSKSTITDLREEVEELEGDLAKERAAGAAKDAQIAALLAENTSLRAQLAATGGTA